MQKYIKNIIKNRMIGGYDLNLIAVVGISTLDVSPETLLSFKH
jgi:hypothetical protein